MRRREFIAGLGGAAVWLVVASGMAGPISISALAKRDG